MSAQIPLKSMGKGQNLATVAHRAGLQQHGAEAGLNKKIHTHTFVAIYTFSLNYLP